MPVINRYSSCKKCPLNYENKGSCHGSTNIFPKGHPLRCFLLDDGGYEDMFKLINKLNKVQVEAG